MSRNRLTAKTVFRRLLPFLIAAAGVTALAQVARFFAVKYLAPVGTAWTVPGFAELSYCENTGASFGMFSDSTAALTVVTALLLLFLLCLVLFGFFANVRQLVVVGMIFGGGFSNMLERIVSGHVVDYFKALFIDFAVFNVADSFITVCSILLVVMMLFIDKNIFDKKK